jgi:hypothetical protein
MTDRRKWLIFLRPVFCIAFLSSPLVAGPKPECVPGDASCDPEACTEVSSSFSAKVEESRTVKATVNGKTPYGANLSLEVTNVSSLSTCEMLDYVLKKMNGTVCGSEVCADKCEASVEGKNTLTDAQGGGVSYDFKLISGGVEANRCGTVSVEGSFKLKKGKVCVTIPPGASWTTADADKALSAKCSAELKAEAQQAADAYADRIKRWMTASTLVGSRTWLGFLNQCVVPVLSQCRSAHQIDLDLGVQ